MVKGINQRGISKICRVISPGSCIEGARSKCLVEILGPVQDMRLPTPGPESVGVAMQLVDVLLEILAGDQEVSNTHQDQRMHEGHHSCYDRSEMSQYTLHTHMPNLQEEQGMFWATVKTYNQSPPEQLILPGERHLCAMVLQ